MVSMSGSGAGYLDENIITPYMHILVFHVPTMMRMHGSLKKLSGQGTFSLFLMYFKYLTLLKLKILKLRPFPLLLNK